VVDAFSIRTAKPESDSAPLLSARGREPGETKIEGRMPGQSVNAIHFRNESLSSRLVATIAFVPSSIVATIATMRTPAGS